MVATPSELSRRAFLQTTALAGGGLLLGFVLPGASRASAAPTNFRPNGFIRITPDNRVTIIVSMAEMGQGVLTALPQLVAEELEADWRQIGFEQAPVDAFYNNPIFNMQGTGGSTSVRAFWEPLRRAGASAREMLITAAADTWKVDRASCHARDGAVVHASGKRLTYGELAAAAAHVTPPAQVTLKDPKDFTIVGHSVRRLDTPAKVNGTAQFGLDVRMPGLLTAVIAHPPVIGAKLVSFDDARAKAVATVRHVVQAGAGVAVVADGYWAAKAGRDALDIRWDNGANGELSSAIMREAMLKRCEQPGIVARHDGDVGAAKPTKTLDAVYEAPYLAHACMEPMNCTASVTAGGVEIWAPTQAAGVNRAVVAQMLGIAPEKVQVHTTLLGGGFGRRFAQDFVIAAVQVSKAVSAPVKVVYTREDDMKGQFYRPASVLKISGGLNEPGDPLTLNARVACSSVGQAGGFSKPGALDDTAVEGLHEWPYETPNVQVEWAQYEPGIGVWFLRSVGNSQNGFFAESFIDELAHAAGKDPFEYRRALLARHPRHRAVLELAADKADWSKPLPAGHARGIAVCESFGTYVAEVVEASLAPDGTPRVHHVVCAVDCGMTVNPGIIVRQMQSAIIFGLSAALHGEITIKNGTIEQANFDSYPVVRMNEAPTIDVYIVRSTEQPGGVGEPGTPPAAPALANALFALTGKRIRRLPFKPGDFSA